MYQKKIPDEVCCPIVHGMEMLRGKWKSRIICVLFQKHPLPSKIGELGNLYVRPEYRGLGIGEALTKQAMAWLREREAAEWLFVYVANGNPVASFYERYGFSYSHEVLGGLIPPTARSGSKQHPAVRRRRDLKQPGT